MIPGRLEGRQQACLIAYFKAWTSNFRRHMGLFIQQVYFGPKFQLFLWWGSGEWNKYGLWQQWSGSWICVHNWEWNSGSWARREALCLWTLFPSSTGNQRGSDSRVAAPEKEDARRAETCFSGTRATGILSCSKRTKASQIQVEVASDQTPLLLLPFDK